MLFVDEHSASPNKAWQLRRQSQRKSVVAPLNPDTPIRPDLVRFVCLGDTHTLLENGLCTFSVPNGDILLHAGDFTNQGYPTEMDRFSRYLGSLPHKVKVVVAGNHDQTLDKGFMSELKDEYEYFSFSELTTDLNSFGVDSVDKLLYNCVYLQDEMVEVFGIKIYGSPWQPPRSMGFQLPRGQACLDKWNLIPTDTDVLLTHSPPLGYGDKTHSRNNHVGCVDLLNTVQRRVKPKYHVFGHIHEGYGTTTDGTTVFINAASCDQMYRAINPPVVFDIPLPRGHTKTEGVKRLVSSVHL